jgi:hypothetical protein
MAIPVNVRGQVGDNLPWGSRLQALTPVAQGDVTLVLAPVGGSLTGGTECSPNRDGMVQLIQSL